MFDELLDALSDCRADEIDVSQDGEWFGVVAWRGDHYCAITLKLVARPSALPLTNLAKHIGESLDRHLDQGQG